MNQEILQKAGDIVAQRTGSNTYCTIALLDEYGYPTVSAVTAAKASGIDHIWFCMGLDSNKAKRIAKCDRASVCFCMDEYNITLVGTAELIQDSAIRKDMWFDGLEHYFSGYDDPNYCVLQFNTKRYNLFVDGEEAQGVR